MRIKKVIVVFKTHLDIGFTGLARDVLDRYCRDFIPAAVKLSFRVNDEGHKKFVWTTGSYLIRHYLEHAESGEKECFLEAVRLGYIRWHGLACTTHSELMDRRLLDYNLSISHGLDRLFGFHTIAAKMTDVPGHTIAIVPALADAGIEFLHIGVNEASRKPSVPSLFRWRLGEKEIVVNYSASYGETTVLENGTALEFYHGHDNSAPPTPEELKELYRRLEKKYPGAHIEAGTLDEFALAVRQARGALPVVETEIGDTWIHGAASDPLKVSGYRRLLRLLESWLADGVLVTDSKAFDAFMENLLLICEHTWGMDTKKFLMDFTNWEKRDFQSARRKDETCPALFSPRNEHLLKRLLPELEAYRDVRGGSGSSYTLFESSHMEQREYLKKAMRALPPEAVGRAEAFLSFSFPEIPSAALSCTVNAPVDTGIFQVTVGSRGELVCVKDKRNGRCRKVSIGLLEYETFGGKEVDNCYFEYGRNLKENYFWAEPDFGKPGLRYHTEIKNRLYSPVPEAVRLWGDTLFIRLRFPREACEDCGCPRQAMAVYRFSGGRIRLELYWKDKDALRSPEALWLSMLAGGNNPACWRMKKTGCLISPENVVHNGARRLHAVEALSYAGPDGRIDIEPLDSPVVSPGGKSLYRTDNRLPDPADGFYFLLYNNRWGTNFKQWFDEDMRFVFDIFYE